MARPERYFIGPNKRNEINEVISRVNGTPMQDGGVSMQTRLQEVPRPSVSNIKLAKTTAAWSKGSLATLEVYGEGTPPDETKKTPADTLTGCVNKFSSVGSGKWVMLAQASNGSWYLIAAECS